MKRSILNMLILTFFLTGLCVIGVNTSFAHRLSDNQLIAQAEDPNEPMPEPDPEMVLNCLQINWLDDDPNEPTPAPEPEISLYCLQVNSVDDDPNEPEPEPE